MSEDPDLQRKQKPQQGTQVEVSKINWKTLDLSFIHLGQTC